MKKIIIISSYATTPEKEKTLNECIDKVSHKGYDVMLTSHYPVPDYAQPAVIKHIGSVAALPHTEYVLSGIITLPCFPEMSEAEVGCVIGVLQQFAELDV